MYLSAGLTWLMAIAVGLIVANLYYIQPLMGNIAREFNVPEAMIGYAVTLCQAGLAAGTLAILPLGDVTDRRRLIMLSCLGAGIALLVMALAPNAKVFLAANFLLGLTSVATHLQVSYAAHLAEPSQRGRAVGAVMSGLLVGVLAARFVSGYAGGWFSWRAIIVAASLSTFALGVILRVWLPRDNEAHNVRYKDLMLSMPGLFATQPLLRQACIYGALTFAVFNAFWANLTFHLEGPPFGFTSKGVGVFSLVAIGGALTANLAGRLTSRIQPRTIILYSLLMVLASFGLFAGAGTTLTGMVLGVILVDLGIQATHIGNQTMVHGLMPEARSRLHCIYMVFYFLGGSVGSGIGTWSFARMGWLGLCLAGTVLSLAAIGFWVYSRTLGNGPQFEKK